MAQDSQSIEFIYDFLYLDRSRIDSWLAQFFDEGVLRSFKQTGTATESNNNDVSTDIKIIGAKLSSGGSATEGHEKVFDSQWSLPLMLIDRLDEAGMINHDVTSAALGELVRMIGNVQMTDIAMLQSIWKPAIGVLVSQQKVTPGSKSAISILKKTLDHLGDVINAMPASPQIYIKDSSSIGAWASLKEDCILVNPATLALAHGASIKGEWRILAVLDAKPDNSEEQAIPPINTSDIAEMMNSVMNLVRTLVGRSQDAYALTPIAIYRAIPVTRSA